MQNSFIRLKHYRPDKADARENHATECLAACLRWSPILRLAFIKFLFPDPDAMPSEFREIDSVEIRTQESIPDGILDLLLSCRGLFVAIEVKVFGNLEEQSQLQRYLAWLR